MAEKKPVPDGWPLIVGDYEVGDPQSCVAICSCGSYFHIEHLKGVAIQGPDKTENIGIEKIVANIVSNPNIRFLIVAGAEVPGHLSGEALHAFWKNGIDPATKKIIGTKGAIPFIENLPGEAIARFRKQIVEVVDMIGVEDYAQLNAKVKEIAAKDPGAFPDDPMIVKPGEEAEAVVAVLEMPLARPASPYMAVIDRAVEEIKYKTMLIARDQKLTSALSRNGLLGFIAGLLGAFILLLPLIILGVMG